MINQSDIPKIFVFRVSENTVTQISGDSSFAHIASDQTILNFVAGDEVVQSQSKKSVSFTFKKSRIDSTQSLVILEINDREEVLGNIKEYESEFSIFKMMNNGDFITNDSFNREFGKAWGIDSIKFEETKFETSLMRAIQDAYAGKSGHALVRLIANEKSNAYFAKCEVGLDGCVIELVPAQKMRHDNDMQIFFKSMEENPLAVVVTDLSHTIEFVNKAFCNMTGYSYDEVIGKTAGFFKSGQTSSSVYNEMISTLKASKSWEGDFINIRKNGSVAIDRAHISIFTNFEGAPSKYIGLLEDITKRTQVETKLTKASERIDSIITEKTSDLTKSLRMAQTAASNRLEILLYFTSKVRTLKESISSESSSHQSYEDFSCFINEINDFSLLESGRLSLYQTEENTDVFLESVRKWASNLGEAKDVSISINIPVEFPRTIFIDSNITKQILMGMLYKSVSISEPNTSIQINTSCFHGRLVFSVSFFKHVDMPELAPNFEISESEIRDLDFSLYIIRRLTEFLGGELSFTKNPSGNFLTCSVPLTFPHKELKDNKISTLESITSIHAGKRALCYLPENDWQYIVPYFDGLGISIDLTDNEDEARLKIDSDEYSVFFLKWCDSSQDHIFLSQFINKKQQTPIILYGAEILPLTMIESPIFLMDKKVSKEKFMQTILTVFGLENLPKDGFDLDDEILLMQLGSIQHLELHFALESMRKPRIVKKMLKKFAESHCSSISKIISALHVCKSDEAIRLANSLKVASATVGLQLLASRCERVEKGLQQGDDCMSLLNEINILINNVVTQIEELK